jgi:hypothetical protein
MSWSWCCWCVALELGSVVVGPDKMEVDSAIMSLANMLCLTSEISCVEHYLCSMRRLHVLFLQRQPASCPTSPNYFYEAGDSLRVRPSDVRHTIAFARGTTWHNYVDAVIIFQQWRAK